MDYLTYYSRSTHIFVFYLLCCIRKSPQAHALRVLWALRSSFLGEGRVVSVEDSRIVYADLDLTKGGAAQGACSGAPTAGIGVGVC